MHWTERNNATARIGAALARRGWTLYGWKEDQSDSMTDYYSPESWDGVASKQGAVAVVDCSSARESGRVVTRRILEPVGDCPACKGTGDHPSGWTLQAARDEPRRFHTETARPGTVSLMPDVVSPIQFNGQGWGAGIPEGENMRGTCGILRCHDCGGRGTTLGNAREEVVETWPKFQGNPTHKLWHVEQDGRMLVSGTGLGPCALHNGGKEAAEKIADKMDAALAGRYSLSSALPDKSVVVATLTENKERDGIELRFPEKPATEVLDRLKGAGWRWSRFSSCWYHKRTPQARIFAEAMISS